MEFKKVKLGEVARVKNGYAFKSKDFTDYGIPIIKIKNICPPLINIEECNYVSEELYNQTSQYCILKGDILISMTGSGPNQMNSAVGKVGRYLLNRKALQNQRVGKIEIIDEQKYDKDFLYYYLSQKNILEYFVNNSTGSANQANISKKIIENLMVPDFLKSTQRKIAKILNTLDSKIEINNKIISNLESQAQAIFKSWFVDFEPFQDGNLVESDLEMIPEGWKVREIKDVSKRINGFSYTSKDIFDESNINMITIKNFDRNGGLQNDSIKPISKNSKIKKDHYLKTNDILMACTDLTQKADIIGGVILYFENEKFDNEIFSMDLIKLVPFEKNDTFFFYYYLKNPIFKLFAENASSGTTVLHLSKKAVDNFKIVYPAKKHIDRFNDYVFPIIKKQRNLLTQNTKLAELRDALLPKLMAGEIDVSNIKIEGEEVKNE